MDRRQTKTARRIHGYRPIGFFVSLESLPFASEVAAKSSCLPQDRRAFYRPIFQQPRLARYAGPLRPAPLRPIACGAFGIVKAKDQRKASCCEEENDRDAKYHSKYQGSALQYTRGEGNNSLTRPLDANQNAMTTDYLIMAAYPYEWVSAKTQVGLRHLAETLKLPYPLASMRTSNSGVVGSRHAKSCVRLHWLA